MRINLKKTLASLAVALMLPVFALAQTISVSGTVTDESGVAIPGAAVMVVNSSNGAVTSVDGTYSLQVSPSAILEVSCMGYTTVQIPVQARSRIDIVLADDAEQIDSALIRMAGGFGIFHFNKGATLKGKASDSDYMALMLVGAGTLKNRMPFAASALPA